jgi:hypothetical protein
MIGAIKIAKIRKVSADAYRTLPSSARRTSSLAKVHGCRSTKYPLARPTISQTAANAWVRASAVMCSS